MSNLLALLAAAGTVVSGSGFQGGIRIVVPEAGPAAAQG